MNRIFFSALLVFLVRSVCSAESPELTVAIAQAGSPRRVWVGEERSQIFVLISNPSDQPKRVWQSWNSWGAHNVELEVVDSGGQKLGVIKNAQHAWTYNFAAHDTISPGESQVFPISIYALGNWEIQGDGLDKLQRDVWHKVRIRASYSIPASKQSQEHRVWTGSLTSPLYDYELRIKAGYTNPRR